MNRFQAWIPGIKEWGLATRFVYFSIVRPGIIFSIAVCFGYLPTQAGAAVEGESEFLATLSREERAWLAEVPVLEIHTDNASAPYQFMGQGRIGRRHYNGLCRTVWKARPLPLPRG